MDKYQQFLNFIRQPKNWLAIAVNIAAVAVCAWSIQYGLSRPFDGAPFGLIMAIGIIFIAGSLVDSGKYANGFTATCLILSAIVGGVAISFVCYKQGTTITGSLIYGVVGFIVGAISGVVLAAFASVFITSITGGLWERKKYSPPIILAIMTFTVLLASSFQNVDARSWKFDRETGAFSSEAVFIWPGSTLEKEYFVVGQKPQKEISVWIWFPAVEDSGWSYEKEGYSFRGEVVLTYKFKNYQAYKRIQGTQLPELPVLADSRAQAPEAVKKVIFMTSGLTSGDVEITKVDGLE